MTKEEIVEKWEDALDCADDWVETNLVTEFLQDLRKL